MCVIYVTMATNENILTVKISQSTVTNCWASIDMYVYDPSTSELPELMTSHNQETCGHKRCNLKLN